MNKKMRTYVICALGVCLCLMAGTFAAAQSTKELWILHTNDTHSRIEPLGDDAQPSEYAGKGGYVRRAAFVGMMRKEHPDLLLLDCGDYSQGTPYYNMFRGEVEIRLMNQMGYDAATIGNHEFDFGLENMARLFRMADFPIVCANYDFTGTVLEHLVKPYIVLKRNGLRIGIFGLSPVLEGLVQASNCKGVRYNDPVAVANAVASHLKGKEHCDLVVCLSHLGWQPVPNNPMCDECLIAHTRNIDVVLGGHSHSYFEKPVFYENLDGEEVPLQQMGKNGVFVGMMQLELEKE